MVSRCGPRCWALLLALVLLSGRAGGQELKCNVQVNSQKIQGTNRNVFQTLQTSLYELLNNTQWTEHVYTEAERIECTMIFTLNEQVGSDEYKGTLNLQARRPIYGTSYFSPLVNILDNSIQFKYIENEKLEFSLSAHLSNLSSLVAYYAYLVLGYDYDTYSPLGGGAYFTLAEQVVQNAQNAAERGWKAYEGNRKNRYWIVTSLLNDKYKPLRRALYVYHRRGLDQMGDKLNEGRSNLLQALLEVQKVYRQKPDGDMYVLQLFLDAKRDEMISAFSQSAPSERARAANVLREIDNAHAKRYDEMVKGGQQ